MPWVFLNEGSKMYAYTKGRKSIIAETLHELRVSVAIPTRSGTSLEKTFESLKNVFPPSPVIEVILAEGYNPSFQRNKACTQARGDILYFMDDDSIVPPHLFRRVLPHFKDKRVVAVGGPSLTPQDDTFLQKCFGYALGSPFGSYRSHYRYASLGGVRHANEMDLIGCNLAVKKREFLDEGGLNNSLYPNEETELLDRLLQKGYIMMYDPEAYIYRSQRKSLPEFISQLFAYGKGRIDQTLLRPLRIRPFYFVPLAFCLYMILLPLLAHIPWAFIPFVLYLLFALSESFRIALKNSDWRILPVMPPIFFVMHISHGCGLLWGLVNRPFSQRADLKPSDVRITRYDGNFSPSPLP